MTTTGRISDVARLSKPFRLRLEKLMGMLAYEGIPLLIYETIRSPARQAVLWSKGRGNVDAVDHGRTVTNAQPYESAHQYGLGADLVFHVNMAWTWKAPAPGMWERMVELAEACGLESLAPREMPHVQWPGFHWEKRTRGPYETAGWLEWLGEPVA